MKCFLKTKSGWSVRLALLFASLLGFRAELQAQTFNVTAFNLSNYTIDGNSDPTLTLQRGVTYIFQLSNVAIHPFWIKTNSGFGGLGAFTSGVINNGASSGSVTFTVPANAPNSLLYQCGNHAGMLGTLNIVSAPSSPPTVRIIHIAVGQNVVVTSTGTNGWNAIPEFNCDPTSTNWMAVAPFTNNFAGGTNVTSFDRLEAVCGSPNVFIRIRNQQN